MRMFNLIVTCCLVCLGMAWPGRVPAGAQGSPKAETPEEARFVKEVIELTNKARAKLGVPPLKRQETLSTAARWMAQDMAAHDYLDHTDRQGRGMARRVEDFG